MKKGFYLAFIILLITTSLGFGQIIQDIPAQKKQTAKEQMHGWNTVMDLGKDKWIIWGAESPILETRTYSKSAVMGSKDPISGEWDYLEYNHGSFFLFENSLIFTKNGYGSFTGDYNWTIGYFYYNYDGHEYRNSKTVRFAQYNHNTHICYNNDKELIEWLKGELKNKNADYPPVKLEIPTPHMEYELYTYSDKDMQNPVKLLYSLPDNKMIQAVKLDSYPTPIDGDKNIKDYIEDIVNHRGFVYNNGSIPMDINGIYIEFIIDDKGCVKNLTIDGGTIFRSDSDRKISFDAEFNNWIANIINNIKFNPGILHGSTVNTYNSFKINYKNPYIIKYDNEYIEYDGLHWRFRQEKNGSKILLEENLYDTIIKVKEGLYEIKRDGKTGVVRFGRGIEKSWTIPVIYDKIKCYNSHFKAYDGKNVTFYDDGGDVIISNLPQGSDVFKIAQEYRRTLWQITNSGKNGLICLIDGHSKTIKPCVYDDIRFYMVSDGYQLSQWVYIQLGDKHGLIRYNSLDGIGDPLMWFKDIDLINSKMLRQGRQSSANFTLWVKLFDRDDLWSLVKYDTNKKEFVILADSKFDKIISDNIVRIKDKKYEIYIQDGKVKKKKIK